MLDVGTKSFGICARKRAARQATVVNTYREVFKRHSVPPEYRYLTLCGQMFDASGGLTEGCELAHLEAEGLITREQFVGVELNQEIQRANSLACPSVTLLHGDILEHLQEYREERYGIINLDTTSEPVGAGRLLRASLAYGGAHNHDMMIVLNLISKTPYGGREYDGEAISDILTADPCVSAMLEEWDHVPTPYVYQGTGENSRTTMTTLVFYRC